MDGINWKDELEYAKRLGLGDTKRDEEQQLCDSLGMYIDGEWHSLTEMMNAIRQARAAQEPRPQGEFVEEPKRERKYVMAKKSIDLDIPDEWQYPPNQTAPAQGAEDWPTAFRITYHTGWFTGYKVSIPNYDGGMVVPLEDASHVTAQKDAEIASMKDEITLLDRIMTKRAAQIERLKRALVAADICPKCLMRASGSHCFSDKGDQR